MTDAVFRRWTIVIDDLAEVHEIGSPLFCNEVRAEHQSGARSSRYFLTV